ncbi:MAG: plastocyanin/azurin family copper-binding protein [Thaumarchaeota archaeon]|nr:plastocyanin/azurin family copper-binding protein [Candidatus Calditenuaceae archaeon]MDW8186826.1 plastocyanin/azurin family copper-binding protein [Nitrososphaerota archaeon]
MDKTITWISLLLIVTGVAGVFLTYSGVSKTFEHGMNAVSALLLLMGVLMLPGGLLRGGPPKVSVKQVVIVGIVVFTVSAALAGAAVVGYGPFRLLYGTGPAVGESPIKVFVSIVPGSWDPRQTENYVPKDIKVVLAINHTVVWSNDEDLDVAHTVTHDGGLFDSGLFGKGETYKYSFAREGLYTYHCVPHPWMRGSVEVVSIPPEQVNEILRRLNVTTTS